MELRAEGRREAGGTEEEYRAGKCNVSIYNNNKLHISLNVFPETHLLSDSGEIKTNGIDIS